MEKLWEGYENKKQKKPTYKKVKGMLKTDGSLRYGWRQEGKSSLSLSC